MHKVEPVGVTYLAASYYGCNTYGSSAYSAQCETQSTNTTTVGVPNTGLGAYWENVKAGDPWAMISLGCGLILLAILLSAIARRMSKR